MNQSVLLVTPPFTQLNTPYPATAYLKGFLNTQNIVSNQADLGIEVILKLFSKEGLTRVFESLEGFEGELSDNTIRIFHLQHDYLQTIDEAIAFLQDKNLKFFKISRSIFFACKSKSWYNQKFTTSKRFFKY